MKNTSYNVSEEGFYGEFGGAFIPEMLFANVEELKTNYKEIISSDSFKNEMETLLRDYVGRPTPLYFSNYLSHKIVLLKHSIGG